MEQPVDRSSALHTAAHLMSTTFTSDNDPELVEAAIPFGLKLYESLLAESPKHAALLLAAAQGFKEFSYAFVDSRIDEAKEQNSIAPTLSASGPASSACAPMGMPCAGSKPAIPASPRRFTTMPR